MELLPYVYTPTVGEACQTYHRLPIRTNGVYITADDAGKVGDALRTRARDVGAGDGDGKLKVAVVTDGERILGESRIPDPGSTPRRATRRRTSRARSFRRRFDSRPTDRIVH
jgi:malic enzyme